MFLWMLLGIFSTFDEVNVSNGFILSLITPVLFLMERTITKAHFMTSLKTVHCIYILMLVWIILYYYNIVWFSVICLWEGSDIFNKKDTSWRTEKIFHTFKKKKKPFWKVNHYQISVLFSVNVIINFIQRPLLYVYSSFLYVWHQKFPVHFFTFWELIFLFFPTVDKYCLNRFFFLQLHPKVRGS